MQGLSLIQKLGQKLSPQQIQFIKLLQVPTAELESRVKEELEENPALEEGKAELDSEKDEYDDLESEESSQEDDFDLDDYLQDDDYASYKLQGDGGGSEEENDRPVSTTSSLNEQLLTQLGYLGLNAREEKIGRQLIGSIEGDGYIRRDIEAIVNDLAFTQSVETDADEVESILHKVQEFDPAGIAARNLQECLILQLDRRIDQNEVVETARQIIENHFEEFTKKHYDKIQKKLEVDDELFKDAINTITKLNPKPGNAGGGIVRTQYLMPDFIITNQNGELNLSLNSRNAPDLRVSNSYSDMLKAYDQGDKKDKKLKDTVSFVKQKLDAAKWFIDAIKQRQLTLLNTMSAILEYQYDYFREGDESKLRPMILKDIAEKIDMDISTVSRVANSKSVQTEFGIFPLKYFFSEGIATESGEDVSSREVKNTLKSIIDKEDKSKPLSDDKLEKLLKEKGYKIARRTVAKYREQLNIPVARLRKEL